MGLKKLISVIHYRKLLLLPTHFLFHFANFACPEAILATEATEAVAEAAEAVAEAAEASDDDDEKDTNLHRRLLSVERKPQLLSFPGCGVYFNQNCKYIIYEQKQKYMGRISSCAL